MSPILDDFDEIFPLTLTKIWLAPPKKNSKISNPAYVHVDTRIQKKVYHNLKLTSFLGFDFLYE